MERLLGKWLGFVLLLLLPACQTPSLNMPPTLETVTLHVVATQETTTILRGLAVAYQQDTEHERRAFRLEEVAYSGLLNTLESDQLGLVNYLDVEAVLWAAPVGYDYVVITCHPDVSVRELTIDEVRDIFAGRATNWREFGGDDLPVEVVVQPDQSADGQAFSTLMMDHQRITRNARLAPNPAALQNIIQQTPGAIGFLTHSNLREVMPVLAVDGQLPSTEGLDYRYTTTVFAVSADEPLPPLHQFVAWLQSPEGQLTVEQYYTPLNP